MTKLKQGSKTVKHSPVTHVKAVKNKPIQKKKNNKFANTPVGKVRLVNGKKVQHNNSTENKLNNKQKEEKEVIKDSPDSPDSNSSSPRSNDKKNSPKQIFNLTKIINSSSSSGKNKKTATKNVEDESDESIEDINEGIILPEDSVVSQDDSDDGNNDDGTDNEESNTDLINILGQSLADDTDEDDSDFEEEENDEDDHDSDQGEASQLKGVKMFKGLLKQKFDAGAKNVQKNIDYDDDDVDDDDDDDDDDVDDDDDDDATDNKDESNLETDTSMSPDGKKNKKNNSSVTENEEDDDEDSEEDEDEDDDDDDDDDDDGESALGLKDLLGNSIVDDDESDEDFEGEDEDDEDIDISDEEIEADVETSDVDKRTIFVGNIPKDTKREEIKKVFKKFGVIESIRIRSVIPVNEKISKKVAAITKQIHKKINHICMYIVFKDEESVLKAVIMNGKKFNGHYLRVNSVENEKTKPDIKKAVFLGNLSFQSSDNDIWDHFGQCGEIESVRLIRDKKTGLGKGIGYVNFQNEDSVPLALELDGSTLRNRQIRVKRCSSDAKSLSKSENTSTNSRNKRSHSVENRVKKPIKKLKVNDETESTSPVVDIKKKSKAKGKLEENSSPNSGKKKTAFQGQTATVGKKGKKSKLDKKKKKMASILTAKPKKVQKV